MKIVSILEDKRIKSTNIMAEISVKEYLEIAALIIENNEFQRRRVSSSKTVYSLLKTDLLNGCLIPPIVLALPHDGEVKNMAPEKIRDFVLEKRADLQILDGLQRTHTLIELSREINEKKDEAVLKKFQEQLIRIEIFIGINRIGILYRMLTLNTGQTPMSLRQQIEILYLDKLKGVASLPGISLIREIDGTQAAGLNQYNFKDIIDGYSSYLERNELPLGKADILENIKTLEQLSKENASDDIFPDFLETWHILMGRICTLLKDAVLNEDDFKFSLFGKDAIRVFKKEQVVAGFGAAVGKLKDYEIIKGFEDIKKMELFLREGETPESFLEFINAKLGWIRNNSKKIGNAQRNYFLYFFRELFNSQGDSYQDLFASAENAYNKYRSQND
ncbi:MAG: hypothetical protein MUF15_00270 [Acidobacteria bacterium]|jgi:hypothetical protein|nr:hypothetical protein [Acidobacteriota bacterium]